MVIKQFVDSSVMEFIDDILVYFESEKENVDHHLIVICVLVKKSCMLNFQSVNFCSFQVHSQNKG